MTIFDNTLYVAKGSGGNGINTVYQLGTPGVLPTTANAPSGGLVNEPYTILPGFPNTAASTNSPGGDYPFGIWFANATTLYVCDEGDLVYTPNQMINGQVNVADAGTLATAGLQKWVLTTTASGSQPGCASTSSRTDSTLACPIASRTILRRSSPRPADAATLPASSTDDGTATIYAITSTISQNGDNGADPNKLVKVTDLISATQPATKRLTSTGSSRFARPAPAKRSAASPWPPRTTTAE